MTAVLLMEHDARVKVRTSQQCRSESQIISVQLAEGGEYIISK